ncbi:hypothetical protein DSO57_1020757 [Entomophthora muscae]|uniref:Uncharacterized protein n=1 Tax=Entomophthora muscae TaxID=34485 RepID=A0ACC2S5H9_9FUNG|nr:hypothetical protein DSO57_1020757 [Entomophthora muscae]
MEGLQKKLERIYCTKYSNLEVYERNVVERAMHSLEVLVSKVQALMIVLLPLMLLYVEEWGSIHAFLFLWGTCEFFFFVYQLATVYTLEERYMGYWDSEKRAAAAEKLLEHMGDPENSAVELLRRWQLDKVESEPCMIHFVNTLVWMFFNKHVQELTAAEALEARAMLNSFKEKLKIPSTIQDKDLVAPKCFHYTLNPVNYLFKAFAFYLVTPLTYILISR